MSDEQTFEVDAQLSDLVDAFTDITNPAPADSARIARRYSRTFRLPLDVDTKKVDAEFDNGVLTITMPRARNPGSAQERKVKVKSR